MDQSDAAMDIRLEIKRSFPNIIAEIGSVHLIGRMLDESYVDFLEGKGWMSLSASETYSLHDFYLEVDSETHALFFPAFMFHAFDADSDVMIYSLSLHVRCLNVSKWNPQQIDCFCRWITIANDVLGLSIERHESCYNKFAPTPFL